MKINLFDDIPANLPEELFTVLSDSDGLRLERIVSDGHASPEGFWYDQEENEWVLLLAGSAVLALETDAGVEQVELQPGDYLLIPARRRHRVASTSPTEKTIWLAVYLTPPA